ncbi:class D beta-lactamase [Vallitalea guaymasensis]|uniref:class D beta-lactamase n=1 Tax=Vallitalea guaymasensis TaxID=1185412 RepID=UPI00272DB969|nr:class D beta-lactamase [Vallitalea guaymasensis]
MNIRKLVFLTLIIISILTACSSNLEDNKIESSDNSIDSNDSEDVASTLGDENKGTSESNIDSDKGEIASKSLMDKNKDSNNIIIESYDKFFENYDGCFVMYDEISTNYLIYNKEQVDERISPCSTFKILNSLIGLETGVIEGKEHMYKWDGKKYPFESWNQDHTLASAIANSVVWYYERLASEVGVEQMQKYLDMLDYGNKDISGGITKFWLTSSFEVSAREQVDLLYNLYHDNLPFSKKNMTIVRDIITLESTDEYILSGKTGTAGYSKIGWFVGTIQRDDKTFYFATNIVADDNATGSKAKEITLEILKGLELY